MIKLKSMWMTVMMLTLVVGYLHAHNKPVRKNISSGQLAPAFSALDVNGNNVSLESLKGKKVLLIFFRNAGCPICNLHMHELLSHAEYFNSKNLQVVGVYESSAAKLTAYTESENIPFSLIADPDKKLYKQYGVGKSFWKGLGSFFFHGAVGKAKQGDKLFKNKVNQDGDMNQLTADFLIDENGKITNAHYGKYLGDHIKIETIKKFIE